MKKFAVYQKDSDDIILVQEGFNFIAAIFGGLWALYNRIWPLFVFGAVLYYLQINLSSSGHILAVKLLSFLFFGLLSDFIYQLYLERQGYILKDVIIAKDPSSAELKYYERNKESDIEKEQREEPWE
ncbi:MAG: hypothetical protein K0R02_198 [Rickettsiaceae bacterium]|jgi:hypothetical protein|nr:hypothetical protein [Rickettsiaceae bacterium]